MDSGQRKQKVRQLFKHYIKMGLEAKGYTWHSDNDAEVDEIVDLLFDEIHKCCAAVDERRERLAAPA